MVQLVDIFARYLFFRCRREIKNVPSCYSYSTVLVLSIVGVSYRGCLRIVLKEIRGVMRDVITVRVCFALTTV